MTQRNLFILAAVILSNPRVAHRSCRPGRSIEATDGTVARHRHGCAHDDVEMPFQGV